MALLASYIFSPPPPFSLDSNAHITQTIPNCRILQISSPISSYENLGSLQYTIFLQECIGDYVLFFTPEVDPIDSAIAMLERAQDYDAIIGVRETKLHNPLQNLISKIFYKIFSIFGNGDGQESLSEFCVLSRKVINTILRTQGDISLLRFVNFDKTLRICKLPYTPLKPANKPIKNSIYLGLDLIITSSYRLLRLGTCLCLLLALFNGLYTLYIVSSFLFLPHITQGWTSTSLYMVVMNTGLFLTLSIMGEYLRVLLIRQKGTTPYEIIDEQSSVVLDMYERNITAIPKIPSTRQP